MTPNWFVFVASTAQFAAAGYAWWQGGSLTLICAWFFLGVANLFFAFLR